MSNRPSGTVSLNKPGSAKSAAPPQSVVPPPPINLMSAALVLMVVLNFVEALALLGHTDALKRYALHANATAKTPQDPFDAVHAVYTLRQSAFVSAILFGILLLLLAFALRRSRTASPCRWAVLVIFVYTQMPLWLLPVSGLPGLAQAVRVIVGLLSIAVLVLIFVPLRSRDYFRACRAANAPAGGAPARPGLGALFAPRPAAPRTAAGARTAANTSTPAGKASNNNRSNNSRSNNSRTASTRTASTRTTAGKPATKPARSTSAPAGTATPARSKTRATERAAADTVGKGDLPRARPTVSKSRRTED